MLYFSYNMPLPINAANLLAQQYKDYNRWTFHLFMVASLKLDIPVSQHFQFR
jgi:hypothetical protein